MNDERLDIVDKAKKGDKIKSLANGKHKYIFLKKADRRTEEEVQHLADVVKENQKFFELELIKEKFLGFFNQRTEDNARDLIIKVKTWIKEGGFQYLEKWVDNFVMNWETIRNYFKQRVTSALSEGNNNVIKSLKRRCFGFRNMIYFKLKIMQVCGFLNSRYVTIDAY